MSVRVRILSVLGIIAINIINSIPIKAQTITYIPPRQDKEKPQKSQSSATRGCRQDLSDVVTMIAPTDHVAHTSLAQPTLFYSVARKIENKALLTIAKTDGRSALVDTEISLNEPGIKTYEFPSNINLEKTEYYIWTITIVCNSQRPSDNIEVQTILKRVPQKEELSNQLLQQKTALEKSQYSASIGLWYDALYYLYPFDSKKAEPYVQKLLEQINLNNMVLETKN
ncbi:DUF928 domain-containing protein [Cyanothece sp. BG0011]|uniref:DUF928 domain-containing protein n=1 Tax=Cyanothece sp. BG0011 TaxID=2082950 RepID=UPI000D1DAADB|nr:DUF928 domain-containing protein [Cyanothece sp. BG0011]